MHRGTLHSPVFIAGRQGQAGWPGAGQAAPARRPLSNIFGLVFRLAGIDAGVGGDETWVEERSRPA